MPTVAEVAQKYIAMRDYIKIENDKHDARMKPYADAMQAMEGWALAHLLENNEQSIKTEFGTVFKKEWTQARLADKEAYVEWICSADDGGVLIQRIMTFFTAAVSKEAVKDFMEANRGALPPGVDFTRGWAAQFRKAS